MSEVQSVQWFPGHMAKTRRAIQSSLKLVDLVAELIDARIPVSSRNPVLKSIIGNKPKIVLLNKSDMADPARTAEWVDYFKQHKTVAIPIDCKTGKGLNRLLPEIKNILREQIAAWERKGMVGRPIRIMVVGVPNVGKSSLINRLGKGGNAGKAAVQDKPGVTRRNQWFTIGCSILRACCGRSLKIRSSANIWRSPVPCATKFSTLRDFLTACWSFCRTYIPKPSTRVIKRIFVPKKNLRATKFWSASAESAVCSFPAAKSIPSAQP